MEGYVPPLRERIGQLTRISLWALNERTLAHAPKAGVIDW